VQGRDVSRENERTNIGESWRSTPCLHFPRTALQGRETRGKLYVHRIRTSRPGNWDYFSTSVHLRRLNSSLRASIGSVDTSPDAETEG
jgi:hypothetical protein